MSSQTTTLGFTPADGPPPSLPDLDLLRCIGHGSYGHVWLARNRTTGKLLAVKAIRRSPTDGADRAGREIKALVHFEANLPAPHDNLLTIHHVGQTDEWFYYTMDLADDASGGTASGSHLHFAHRGHVPNEDVTPGYRPATLGTRLEGGPLAPDECLDIARQLLAGLAHLHGAALVHRDVKPSNCVFVGGKLKLADFGLVTQTGGAASLIGTPRYMPPDGVMDTRADVYAAGLVVYEMLTGLPADSFPRLTPRALKTLRHPAAAALNRLALRAAHRDRAGRFEHAGEMLEALTAPAKPRPRRPMKRLLAVAAGLVAAIAALVAFLPRPAALARVDVNFITYPFEAEIELDGRRAVDPSGRPYTTPCTIAGLPARAHRVVFRRAGLPDLVREADFSTTREIESRWRDEPAKGKSETAEGAGGNYASPQATFNALLRAIEAGDGPARDACFTPRASKRPDGTEDISDELPALIRQARKVELGRQHIEGDTATLGFLLDGRAQFPLHFTRVNGAWKINRYVPLLYK